MPNAATIALGRTLERKDDTGTKAAPRDVTKDAIHSLMNAFEEFKTQNEERLKQIEAKGAEDPVTAEKLSKLEAEMRKIDAIGEKAEKAAAAEKALADMQAQLDTIETAMNRPAADLGGDKKAAKADQWARAVVNAHLVGVANLSSDQRKALEHANDEWKALRVTPDTAGGYLAPMEYVREITKGVTEMSPVRSVARVRTTAAKTVEIPKRTGQFSAQWVSEQGTRSETTGLTYGLDEIPTHEFYALVDISNQMLEDSAFNMADEIAMEATEQFSVAEGAAFVAGSGVGRPQGFLTNADVGTTNSGAATTITADGMHTLKHAIKTAYTANARWVMNRTTMGSVRKLKDGQGQYLWQPGIAQGRPNTIDGDPYTEMPDMPNEGAGLKPIAYGDFRRAYTWVDRITMQMLRDPYTQATAGNVRFIMRKRVGGQVVLAEAIRVLVCAA